MDFGAEGAKRVWRRRAGKEGCGGPAVIAPLPTVEAAPGPAGFKSWRGLRGSGGDPARLREGDQAPVLLVPELESHCSQTVP